MFLVQNFILFTNMPQSQSVLLYKRNIIHHLTQTLLIEIVFWFFFQLNPWSLLLIWSLNVFSISSLYTALFQIWLWESISISLLRGSRVAKKCSKNWLMFNFEKSNSIVLIKKTFKYRDSILYYDYCIRLFPHN